MIEIRGLTKRYGAVIALDGADVTMAPGAITILVGPNGSGKSTLIKSLLGLVRSDAGVIMVNGVSVANGSQYRRDIGYMPQTARFPENMNGYEIAGLLARVRGDEPAILDELINDFALELSMTKPVRTLSGGTRQRLSAALAFCFNPRIVILDEPTASLDPLSCVTLKERVRGARKAGAPVIMTSHIMSEVEELADRVVFLLEGRIVAQGAPVELCAQVGTSRLDEALPHLMRRAGGAQ